MDEIKRYVIRRVKDGLYYNGKPTFSYSHNFQDFEKAKVFNNTTGAKNACLHLELRKNWYIENKGDIPDEYEIVEIITKVTDNVIKYERKHN